MKHIFSFFSLLVFAGTTFGQLTKGHWLVGGSGRFYSYKNEYSTSTVNNTGKYTQIDVSPNIGYFIADKIGLGLRTTFSSVKGKIDNVPASTNVQRFSAGPFIRYYFFDAEKQNNILIDANYQKGIVGGFFKGNSNNFSIAAGPVIYFNSSVGIEFLIGYVSQMEEINNQDKEIKSGFQFSIGFQIHLIK
jgi:hypothetical protein